MLRSFLAGMAMLFAGCAAGSADVLSPSPLSLEELEKRMNAASDPDGLFAASKSYVMKQEIKELYWLNDDVIRMVEVKFEKPDKFALITYEDNQPSNIFCTDGESGWVAYYRDRKIVRLDEAGLRRMQTLASLGTPGAGGYSSVFKDVQIYECRNDDGQFFRIDCKGPESDDPISFYVDANDYLLRRVKMSFLLPGGKRSEYENLILDYELRDGVRIPMATRIIQDGVKQESKVIYYKLNPEIPAGDFQPPVFWTPTTSRRNII